MAKRKKNKRPGFEADANAKLISLIDILYIIRNRWKTGFFAGAAFALLFIYAVVSREDVYEAQASMIVELNSKNMMDIRRDDDTRVTNVNLLNTYMNTYVQRLKTRELAEAVVDSLSAEELQDFLMPYVVPESERPIDAEEPDSAGLMMKYALTVDRGEDDGSQLIRLVISHPNAAMAQRLANAYVDGFINYIASLRSTSTSEASDFLGRQVKLLRDELEEAETELQEFRWEHNLFTLQQDKGIVVERLRRLSDAETNASIRLLEAESRVEQIEKAQNDLDRLLEIPFIGGLTNINSIYNQLNELKRERQALDATYLKRHPRVLENEASQQSVSAALALSVEHACKQVESECSAIRFELSILDQKTSQAEQAVLDTERSLLVYKRQERSVENLHRMLDLLSTRYNETNIAQKIDLNNVRVLNRARLPSTSNALSRVQVLAGALFLGGVFLVGVPLGIELLDNRLSSFSDIEFYSGKPLLGDLRFFPKKDIRELSQAVLRNDEDLVESFRLIYTNLRLKNNLGEETLSILVTSSLPSEGKSVVSSNLAGIFSSHGYKVLLVDCDLRRSTLQSAFEKNNDLGLLSWYKEAVHLDDPTGDKELAMLLGIVAINGNLSLLPSGGTSSHATEVLGDRKVAKLFERLKAKYDVVIYDTAPVGLFSDATLVAEYADTCVFVARQYHATRSKVRNSISLMEHTNAAVLGVVFNGIKNVPAAVGYGNHSRNHYGAGYEKNRKKYKGYYDQAS